MSLLTLCQISHYELSMKIARYYPTMTVEENRKLLMVVLGHSKQRLCSDEWNHEDMLAIIRESAKKIKFAHEWHLPITRENYLLRDREVIDLTNEVDSEVIDLTDEEASEVIDESRVRNELDRGRIVHGFYHPSRFTDVSDFEDSEETVSDMLDDDKDLFGVVSCRGGCDNTGFLGNYICTACSCGTCGMKKGSEPCC